MAVKYLDDKAPDGAIFGRDSTAAIGFYGTTTASRPALSNAAVGTGVAVSTTTGAITSWGFSTSTQANAIVSLLNEIRGHLTTLGLMA